MNELTDKKELKITETIARACGWKFACYNDTRRRPIFVADGVLFEPLGDWDDAMRAADALGVDGMDLEYDVNENWRCELEFPFHDRRVSKHPNRLTAFCLALHEIAKAKLEE